MRFFVEKPSIDLAKEYIKSGKYFWNSGMFVWKAATLLHEIETHLPKLHAQLDALTINTIEAKGKYPYRIFNESGKKKFDLVNKKVIKPEYKEQQQNPSSRSAKLRIIERLA